MKFYAKWLPQWYPGPGALRLSDADLVPAGSKEEL